MDALYKLCIYVISILTRVTCERLELPAFEYTRRFNQSLSLGQCAHRLVQYPAGPFPEPCTYPNRSGAIASRLKAVDSQQMIAIASSSQLIQHVGMCNDKSAAYFGLLLSKEDCLAKEIASKMTFKPKSVIWMYKEHFRPRIVMLNATPGLDIPGEYSLYLDNMYYTEYIGIGTEEFIIAELQFRNVEEAKQAYEDRHNKMTDKLVSIAKHVGLPRTVKVTRLSTSDTLFETKVFKDQYAVFKAIQYVETCEKHIARIRLELLEGLRNSHLQYGFMSYEIDRPIAATQKPKGTERSSLSAKRGGIKQEEKRRKNWEEVAVLQIEAKRIHAMNRKHRKFCRSTMKKHKYCVHLKQTMRALKKLANKIYVQRREWCNISFYQQSMFIEKEKQKLKKLKDEAKMLAKKLRKFMKKKS